MTPAVRYLPLLLALLAVLAQATPVSGQVPAATRPSPVATPATPLRTEARMALQLESLSNGSGDWRDASFEITGDAGRRRRWYGAVHDVRRFSRRDDLLVGAYVHPLGSNAVVTFEAQGSFSHQIVPRVGLAARIDARVGRGWVVNGGVSGRRYDTGDVTMATAGVEKYVGPFRLAYTSYGAFLAGEGSLSHAGTIDRSYGPNEDNVIGVTLSAGEEFEQDASAGLRASRIQAIAVRGRHWFGRRIGVLYTIGAHEQGTYYTRRGGTVGLTFRF